MTGAAASTPSGQQIARMERDLAALQTQVKSARKLTASTICILPSHADTLPSCSPTLASLGGFRITAQNVLGSFRKSLRSKRSVLSRRPRRRKIPYGAETWPTGITKRSRLVRPGSHNVSTGRANQRSRFGRGGARHTIVFPREGRKRGVMAAYRHYPGVGVASTKC